MQTENMVRRRIGKNLVVHIPLAPQTSNTSTIECTPRGGLPSDSACVRSKMGVGASSSGFQARFSMCDVRLAGRETTKEQGGFNADSVDIYFCRFCAPSRAVQALIVLSQKFA